jgi:serine/threonine protein kinase
MREIPSFRCNPWDFYEPFLKLGSGLSLVLCNNRTELRVMRTFGVASHDEEVYCFPEVQHLNFVNICERYLFEDEIFVFTEYVGFSIEDMLLHLIYPTEREIAYIISQVSRISPFPRSTIPLLTSQVLAGIQFIWSRKLDHPRISTENILVSLKGEVKIGEKPNAKA